MSNTTAINSTTLAVTPPVILTRTHCHSQIVIPARLASTRLPEKLLLRETGKTVLQHTFESASKATLPKGIVVAVDCERLERTVHAFGGRAVLTDPGLQSGTDRVAAVAREMPEVDVFVNVQGDEPEISATAIDEVTRLLELNPQADVATLAAPIRDRHRLEDPLALRSFATMQAARCISAAVLSHTLAAGMSPY